MTGPTPPARGDGPLPFPPMSELGAAAVQLHEAYRTYVAAGFTEAQAFAIMLTCLRIEMERPR